MKMIENPCIQEAAVLELEELNRRCCLNISHLVSNNRIPNALSPRLIVPAYSGGESRVSEQEARFAFVEALSGTSVYYSVETPTKGKYCFKGTSGNERSAQTDLTLYVANGGQLNHWVNVEFKKGNAPDAEIMKDIEKLIKEQSLCPIIGNWFHLLENADRGTFNSLFGKLEKAMRQQLQKYTHPVLYSLLFLRHANK